MNSKRFYFVMLGAVVLLVVLFGFVAYQADILIHKESDKLMTLKLEDKIINKRQDGLEKAQKDIKDYESLEAISKTIIPEDKDQANAIGEITYLANQTGISLGVIQFPQSDLGKVQKGKQTITDDSRSQLTEVEGLKGVYSMSIDISNHSKIPVSYDQIIEYLSLLEGSRRTSHITDVSIRPDQEVKGKFHFNILINIYVRPT